MSGVLGGLAGSSKGILNVQSLIVGGGGGAGTAVGNFTYTGTGGGGGGAHRSVTALDVRLFTNYTVTVGAGGTNRANGNSSSFQGASLPLGGYDSQGGGGGGEYSAPNALDGASGGGGGAPSGIGGFAILGQGSIGGNASSTASGGGGGAGGVGGNGSGNTPGAAGLGVSNSITGTPVTRARGGKGNYGASPTVEQKAANTGDGGDGGVNNVLASSWGGSGVVIFRYPDNFVINIGAGLVGTTSAVGTAEKVTTITAGTGNVSWSYGGIIETDFLVIAGGGSGAIAGSGSASSGGAAGGYRTSFGTSGGNASAEPKLQLFHKQVYTVTVGAGGVGVATGQTLNNVAGDTGNNSSISEASVTIIESLGGARGRQGGNLLGFTGGSSSGNGTGTLGTPTTTVAGTTGQGSAGGLAYSGGNTLLQAAGGSGGAGQNGADGTASSAGNGGNGLANSITGTSVTRAGGGGASASSAGTIPNGAAGTGGASAGVKSATSANATANTGSGSGGASGATGVPGTGNGGSGVVILRYPNTFVINLDAGLTGTTVPVGTAEKVTIITAGTGNVSFT